MRGYLSRMLAVGVSRHTVPVLPEPERAEFESQVYDLTYAARTTHQSRTSFSVLALSRAHAEELGRLRLEQTYGPGAPAEMFLVEAVAWGFDVDRVTNLLQIESPAERAHRRETFAARSVA